VKAAEKEESKLIAKKEKVKAAIKETKTQEDPEEAK